LALIQLARRLSFAKRAAGLVDGGAAQKAALDGEFAQLPQAGGGALVGAQADERAVVGLAAAPFNAAGDGVTDDTEAIRRALRSVERSGGVVHFPNGQYVVSAALFVHGNNTVLRGESRDGTRLIFTRPLDRALGINIDERGESRWRWTGGLSPRFTPSFATRL
jgi:hypothetical protein